MKKNALLVIIVLLAVVGGLFFFGQNSGQRTRLVREGDRAPEFTLPTLDGKPVSLSAYRGKVVMVHFWATWCPPCVEELPTLEGLYRSNFGKDFELLAVSVDEGGAGVVREFMQRNRFVLPVLMNPDQSVSRAYGTYKFPETYLVDREGVVRKKIIGAANWASPDAVRLVQELVGKK